jgi:molecular chaperone GrpE|tara:strand:- start:310 stop:810 length:501 start_codon:yes stop_codon:yes gene_type:complete
MNKEEESSIEEADNASDESSDAEEVIEETSVPLSEYEKIKDDYLRLAAEFDNFKKRTEKEKESIGTASVAYFVNSLFPLIDNFEMAMNQEEVSKELETFKNLLNSVLEGLQVEEIGTVGDNFDPSIHEAVEHSGEGESQKVETILRKGYLFQGNLIRPAMVKVKSE